MDQMLASSPVLLILVPTSLELQIHVALAYNQRLLITQVAQRKYWASRLSERQMT